MDKLKYAEDVGHYWKTSSSSADSWLDKAKKLIASVGGKITEEVFASKDNMSAFMLTFEMKGDEYKIMWPVLKSKSGDTGAAKRQAATMLYHDVKARVMTSKIMGERFAFHQFYVLPDGRTASQLTGTDISASIPSRLLPAPEVIEVDS